MSRITLQSFAFGQFCRDGAFSAEVKAKGDVCCDAELRELQLRHSAEMNAAMGSVDEISTCVRFHASHITGVVTCCTPPPTTHFRVFIEVRSPPTFEISVENDYLGELVDARPQRHSSLPGHTPLPSHCFNLCLSFNREQDQAMFVTQIKKLHTRVPTFNPLVIKQGLYSNDNIVKLDKLMVSLEFALAFEVHKAVSSGLLTPLEILESLKDPLFQLQKNHGELAAPIFRYFTAPLSVPSLRSGTSPDKVSSTESLVEQLANAASTYIADLYRPRARFAPSPAVYNSYHVAVTPATRYLEGPLPDQSNSILRRWGNHESFLRVTFQDENRGMIIRKPDALIDTILDQIDSQRITS